MANKVNEGDKLVSDAEKRFPKSSLTKTASYFFLSVLKPTG